MFNQLPPNSPINFVVTNHYYCVPINHHAPLSTYTAIGLTTCFAYIIYSEQSDKSNYAIIYHAPSGMPDKIPHILETEFGNDFKIMKIIAAIPGAMAEPTNQFIINQAKKILDMRHIEVIENMMCYSLDNRGRHGMVIGNSPINMNQPCIPYR